MFNCFNFEEFGIALKDIRKRNGLRQQDIQDRIGINTDTVRRIEAGSVVPKYDTIELLSYVYKLDLLNVLKKCRVNKPLTNFYNNVDQQLALYNAETYQQFRRDFNNSVMQIQNDFQFITDTEIKEMSVFLDCVPKAHSTYFADLCDAETLLIESFMRTHPGFDVANLKKYNYSYLETRMLLTLSIAYANQNKIKMSTDILIFLLKILEDDWSFENNRTKMILKIYANLAYNFHIEEQQKKVIQYCDQALEFATSNETLHLLYFFYYRKGIAQFELNQKTYIESLKYSVDLLIITKNTELLKMYREITLKKYNIDINPPHKKQKQDA